MSPLPSLSLSLSSRPILTLLLLPSPLFHLSRPPLLLTSSLLPAVQSLQAMSTCSAAEEEDSLGLISLAAQMAFEVSNSPLLRVLLQVNKSLPHETANLVKEL